MIDLSLYHWQAAEFIMRILLAILFIAQGYDKIFNVKISGVVSTFSTEMESKNIPHVVFVVSAYLTSIIEFLGGILLLLGFLKSFTLMMLGFDLVLVSLAFSILQPMWDMKYVFPRIALLLVLLMMPNDVLYWTLDNFLNKI